MSKRIKYKGIEFKSLKELHAKNGDDGISYSKFYSRVTKGWEIENALKDNSTKFSGEKYASLKSLFDKHATGDITYGVFCQRIRAGWSIEEALTSCPNDRFKNQSFDINGKTYETLKELHSACATNGISYQGFYQRLLSGWKVEEALTVPISDVINREYLVNGTVYPTLKDLSVAAKISYSAAIKRRDRGWTDEEIFFGRKSRSKKQNTDKTKACSGTGSLDTSLDYAARRISLGDLKPFFSTRHSLL
jgi:hypothetical protein